MVSRKLEKLNCHLFADFSLRWSQWILVVAGVKYMNIRAYSVVRRVFVIKMYLRDHQNKLSIDNTAAIPVTKMKAVSTYVLSQCT